MPLMDAVLVTALATLMLALAELARRLIQRMDEPDRPDDDDQVDDAAV